MFDQNSYRISGGFTCDAQLQKEHLLGGGIVLDELAVLHLESLADPVDLLVDLRAVVVALLTGPDKRQTLLRILSKKYKRTQFKEL
jgi:hypothetical protein